MHYTTQKIDGISMIFVPVKDATSTCIEVLVKAWSIYESKEENGLSHFLEHMFFKWGQRYKTPLAVSEALDTLWASYNAFTGDEYAWYRVKCAPKFTSKAMDVLSDMLVNTQFPEDEMEREKGVVIQEIAMYEDNPSRLVMDKRKNRYYGDTNYGRSIIWTEENVQSFTRDMLLEHKRKLYTKDNLVIAVAWSIPDEIALSMMIKEYFGGLPDNADYELNQFEWDHYPDVHEAFYDKWTQQHHVLIGANGFTINEHERYAAKVAMTIFGWMMSSRLFQNIREKQGLCYYIWAGHYAWTENGMFVMYAWMEKERWEQWLQAIYDETAKVVDEGITAQEFDKALNNIEWGIALWLETSDQIAGYVSTEYLLKWSVDTLEERLKAYKSLSLDDVNWIMERLAREHLYAYWIQ